MSRVAVITKSIYVTTEMLRILGMLSSFHVKAHQKKIQHYFDVIGKPDLKLVSYHLSYVYIIVTYLSYISTVLVSLKNFRRKLFARNATL